MRSIIAVVVFGALLAAAGLAAADPAPTSDRPIVLALNPQPEPPGRAKIKRIYTKEDDSRRQLKNKNNQKNVPVVAPATKY